MKPLNSRQLYQLRAEMVHVLRGMGFKIAEIAAAFECSKEKVRALFARRDRQFKQGRVVS